MKKFRIGGLCYYISRALVDEWQELYDRVLDVSTILMWLAIKGIDHDKDSPVLIQETIEKLIAEDICKFKMLTGHHKKQKAVMQPPTYDIYEYNIEQAYASY